MNINFDKYKSQYDVIFLSDNEIGIDSGHENERPCLLLKVNEDNSGYVIPLTSKNKSGFNSDNHHKLSFGSWINLNNRPIFINSNQLTYSRLSEYYLDDYDIEIIEYRYSKWI